MSKPWTTLNYLEITSLIKGKPKQFFSSTIMKITPSTPSIHQILLKLMKVKEKNNSKANYSKHLEKLILIYFKLTFIQLSLITLMLEEFIWDHNKQVKALLLIMQQKEMNFINSLKITIELLSTLMLIPKHLKKLNKLKEKQVKLPRELKTPNKIWKNQKNKIQQSTNCHWIFRVEFQG